MHDRPSMAPAWEERSRRQKDRSFGGPLGAKNARANVESKYGERDEKGPAPGELLPVSVRALHEIVDRHRQVRHRLGQVEAEELVGERGEKKRGAVCAG